MDRSQAEEEIYSSENFSSKQKVSQALISSNSQRFSLSPPKSVRSFGRGLRTPSPEIHTSSGFLRHRSAPYSASRPPSNLSTEALHVRDSETRLETSDSLSLLDRLGEACFISSFHVPLLSQPWLSEKAKDDLLRLRRNEIVCHVSPERCEFMSLIKNDHLQAYEDLLPKHTLIWIRKLQNCPSIRDIMESLEGISKYFSLYPRDSSADLSKFTSYIRFLALKTHDHPSLRLSRKVELRNKIKVEHDSHSGNAAASQRSSKDSLIGKKWDMEEENGLGSLRFEFQALKVDAHRPVLLQTDVREEMIIKVMKEAYNILDSTWANYVLKHASDGSETSESGSSGKEISSGSSQSAGLGQKHTYDDETLHDGNRDNGNGKRPKSNKVFPHNSSMLPKLACPFYKRNPEIYCSQKSVRYRVCAGPGWHEIGRVKEHLTRCHLAPIHCIRCYKEFKTHQEHERHQLQDPPCAKSETRRAILGLTVEQKDSVFKRAPKTTKTEPGKWTYLYRKMFPDETIPSPFYDSVEDTARASTNLSRSETRAEIEAYLNSTLPRLVESAMEEEWSNEPFPLPERAKRRLADTIRGCVSACFNHDLLHNANILQANTPNYDENPELNFAASRAGQNQRPVTLLSDSPTDFALPKNRETTDSYVCQPSSSIQALDATLYQEHRHIAQLQDSLAFPSKNFPNPLSMAPGSSEPPLPDQANNQEFFDREDFVDMDAIDYESADFDDIFNDQSDLEGWEVDED